MTRRLSSSIWFALLFTITARANAQDLNSTLTLDGLSFISFQDVANYPIPSGSSIGVHFGTPASDGSVPVSIDPAGVNVVPIPLGQGGGVLRYTLASPGTGTLRKTSSGAVLELNVTIGATLVTDGGGGTFNYPMRLTTEATAASDQSQTTTINVSGARLDLAAHYVQLVGATTNRTQAYPEPGKAVYTVLSGSFDHLPSLP